MGLIKTVNAEAPREPFVYYYRLDIVANEITHYSLLLLPLVVGEFFASAHAVMA